MKSKLGKAMLLLFVSALLTSCKKWILFDVSRFTFGFFSDPCDRCCLFDNYVDKG